MRRPRILPLPLNTLEDLQSNANQFEMQLENLAVSDYECCVVLGHIKCSFSLGGVKYHAFSGD